MDLNQENTFINKWTTLSYIDLTVSLIHWTSYKPYELVSQLIVGLRYASIDVRKYILWYIPHFFIQRIYLLIFVFYYFNIKSLLIDLFSLNSVSRIDDEVCEQIENGVANESLPFYVSFQLLLMFLHIYNHLKNRM